MTAVYVFGAVLAALFVSIVIVPFVRREPPPQPLDRLDPRGRQEKALQWLREVEFEHETGKLSDEDYRELKSRYARLAVEARREAGGGGRAGEGAAPGAGEAPEAPGAGEAPEAGQTTCPACGAPLRPSARFCTRCGAAAAGGDDPDRG